MVTKDDHSPRLEPEPPPAPKSAENQEPQFCGLSMKWISLILLTLQTSGQALLIKWSDAQGQKTHMASTVVFWTEAVKFWTSLLLVLHESGGFQQALDNLKDHFTQSSPDLMKAAVPSLIYTIQNNLMFYSFSKLSAPVQQVLYQMKIITTAGLGVVMLQKSLGRTKWSACFLLAFGVAIVQLSRSRPGEVDTSVDMGQLSSDHVKGFLAVITACFTSGFAGVWIQKMLQQTTASIWMRNVQLGLFGSAMSLIVATMQDGATIFEDGFHKGYNIRVVLVILMNALGGLLCAVMLKYAGATHGCFSTALSIILTCILSAVLLRDFQPDFLFVLGTLTSIAASLIFALGYPSWTPCAKCG